MIEYLKYGMYLLIIVTGAVALGLLLFEIIDTSVYVANKLGNLIFGKGGMK